MKRIIVLLSLIFSFSYSQTGFTLKTRTLYADSIRANSTIYGTLDTQRFVSRSNFTRPIKFDSALTLLVKLDTAYSNSISSLVSANSFLTIASNGGQSKKLTVDTSLTFNKLANNVITNQNIFTARQFLTSAGIDTMKSRSEPAVVNLVDSLSVTGLVYPSTTGTYDLGKYNVEWDSAFVQDAYFSNTSTSKRHYSENSTLSRNYIHTNSGGKYTVTADSSGDVYAKTLSAGINVHSIDLDGSTEWMATSSPTSSIQPLDTQRVSNPYFETNITGWAAYSGTLTRQTTYPILQGTASAREVESGANSGIWSNIGWSASKNYSVSFLVRATTINQAGRSIFIARRTSTGTAAVGRTNVVLLSDTATTYFVKVNYRTDVGSNSSIDIGGTGTSNTWRIDKILVNEIKPFAIQAWVKYTGSAWIGGVGRKLNDSTINKGYALAFQDSTSGKPSFIISDSLTQTKVTWGSAINDGNWHLVVGRVHPHGTSASGGTNDAIDSALISISVDAGDSLTSKVAFIPYLENDSLLVGRYGNTTTNYGVQNVGEIKVVKDREIYNSNIKDSYESGFSLDTTSVVGWYQWKTSGVLNDKMGYNNLSGRSVDINDQAVATFPSRQSGLFYADNNGNSTQIKATSDSLSINGKVNFLGLTTDSTTCARGQLWLKASDGTIHVKY